MREFKAKWGVPQRFGAIDGTHIPLTVPSENHTDYYNHKGWYSMLIQGLVDANYCFLDICVGWPGSVHDARVFVHYKRITENHLIPDKTEQISSVDVPFYMIGDSAYLMLSWLMKPFSFNSDLTTQQHTYNYRISRARIVAENTFGRLKARWRRLMKRNDMYVLNVPVVAAAVCVLHSICEIHLDHFNDAWLVDNDGLAQPATTAFRDVSASTLRFFILSRHCSSVLVAITRLH